MSGFDPDASKDACVRGFTSCDPDDLPAEIPSRALADNLDNKKEVTGAMRTGRFGTFQEKNENSRVSAYKSVQFGNKAASQDAEDDNVPDVGDYTDNGE
jgi:hypothetical protein